MGSRCGAAAGVAAEHGIPLPVISAGTRNHSALDPLGAYAANVYGMGDIAGLGRRARLDRGTLGMFAVTVSSAVQATGLLAGTHSCGLTRLAAPQVVVDADASQIPVGVDGEALCSTPRALHRPAGRPAGPGAPVTAPGCPIPSRSWTRTGCGRSPDCAISREGRPSSITERDGDDPGHPSRFSRSILPICSSREASLI